MTSEAVAPAPASTGNRREIQIPPNGQFRWRSDLMKVRPRHSNFNNTTCLPLWDAARRAELRALPPAARALAIRLSSRRHDRPPDRGAGRHRWRRS